MAFQVQKGNLYIFQKSQLRLNKKNHVDPNFYNKCMILKCMSDEYFPHRKKIFDSSMNKTKN